MLFRNRVTHCLGFAIAKEDVRYALRSRQILTHKMPRMQTPVVLNGRLVRHYLQHGRPANGRQLARDAIAHGEPGARAIIKLALDVRCNERTRRQYSKFVAEFGRRNPSRWFLHYLPRVFSLFKVLRKLARPNARGQQPTVLHVSHHVQRRLVSSGLLDRTRSTLREEATQAASELLSSTAGSQMVLWLDNLYWQRFCTTPLSEDLSQNVTAMAVLVLTEVSQLNVHTRSVAFPRFPGHLEFYAVLQGVDQVVSELVAASRKMVEAVQAMGNVLFQRKDIRVPLDVQRSSRPRIQWRPWSVEQLQVGSNADLLKLVLDVSDIQGHSRHDLPLLVDENIHYRLLRLMYSSHLQHCDVGDVLQRVPLVYGVWHAYKHTVVCVYRAFFPLLAQLEATGTPAVGSRVCSRRRVLHMEKLVAALLLVRQDVLDEIRSRINRVLTLFRDCDTTCT